MARKSSKTIAGTINALWALIDIAIHQSDGPVSLTSIAERQAIDVGSLRMALWQLWLGGLVKVQIGRDYGYQLARTIEQIALADVLAAVDESAAFAELTRPSHEQDFPTVTNVSPLWLGQTGLRVTNVIH